MRRPVFSDGLISNLIEANHWAAVPCPVNDSYTSCRSTQTSPGVGTLC